MKDGGRGSLRGALGRIFSALGGGSGSTRKVAAEYERAITLAMLRVMMADGVMKDAEVRTVARIYHEVTGRELSAEDIEEEAATVRISGLDLAAALAEIAPYLAEEGKELAVRAAIKVAIADGAIAEEERAMVREIAGALGLSESRLRAALDELEAGR